MPLEREIAGDNPGYYRMTLRAGQFLHLIVQQRGIDLLVRLFGPDGAQTFETDSPNGAWGSEHLVVVAEQSGSYRLEVRSANKDAPAGNYEVRIEELRSAGAQDRQRASAEMVLASTFRMESIPPPVESLKQAIRRYDELLPLVREMAYLRGEAYPLVGLGRANQLLHGYRAALEFYRQAVPLLEKMEDCAMKASVVGNAGLAYDSLGDWREALKNYNLALTLERSLGDRGEEAVLLNNIAATYDRVGERQNALVHYNQALSKYREVGDHGGEAISLSGVGLIYQKLGERQKALESFSQALLILQSADAEGRGAAHVLSCIGLAYDSLGDTDGAIAYYRLALPIQKRIVDRRGEAITLTNLGAAYKSSGEMEKARGAYEEALAILDEIAMPSIKASTLTNLGIVYETLSGPRRALQHYKLALDLAKAAGNRETEAVVLKNIASVHASLGETGKAFDYFDQSLFLSRAVKDRKTEAATLYLLARTQRNCANLAAALSNIESAIDIVESLRTKVVSPELRSSYLSSVQQYYELCIDVLMRLNRIHPGHGYDRMALQMNERGRARTLLEMLTEAGVDVRKGVNADLLERERSLRSLLDGKTERQTRVLNGTHTGEDAAEMKKEIDWLIVQFQEVASQIRASSPQYAGLTQPHPLTLKQIQEELLDSDTVMLQYALGEERSYLWAVTRDYFATFELPNRNRIEELAKRGHELLTLRGTREPAGSAARRRRGLTQADAEYDSVAAELSRMLLPSAVLRLEKKRLPIVSDGALNYVAFSALPEPSGGPDRSQPEKRFSVLIDKHEIITIPSASALAVLRKTRSRPGPAQGSVMIFADPVFDGKGDRVRLAGEAVSDDRPAEESASSDSVGGMALTRSAKEVGLTRGEGFRRLPFSRAMASPPNVIVLRVSPK